MIFANERHEQILKLLEEKKKVSVAELSRALNVSEVTIRKDLELDDEDFIFLGPGYTCLEVAKNLKSKNRLAITTMNVSACIELADTPEFNVMLVPGSFTKRNGTYYVTGSVLIDYFSNSYFDKIFLTMDGISLERGFSVLDDITARIFHVLLKHTNQVIVCAASGKFGKNAMAPLGPLSIADVIVTDRPVPEEYRRCFEEQGVKVMWPE